jgi:SAM-dependent methyltransferase
MSTTHKNTIDELSQKNKDAWNQLYGATKDLVWGEQPSGFIEPFIPYIAPSLSETSRLLDAGTGEGRNLPKLLELSGKVYACDASANALKKVPVSLKDSVEIHVCDLSQTPFDKDFFDFVLLSDVVETLPDPLPTLQEIYRILKPGGYLLCNIPGFEDSIAEINMDAVGENEYLYQGQYFYRFINPEESTEMLLHCGFHIVHHQLCTWLEDAHPAFRHDSHQHSSYVFLAAKQFQS